MTNNWVNLLKDLTDKREFVMSEIYYESVMIAYGVCFDQNLRQKITKEILAEKMKNLGLKNDYNKYYEIDHQESL